MVDEELLKVHIPREADGKRKGKAPAETLASIVSGSEDDDEEERQHAGETSEAVQKNDGGSDGESSEEKEKDDEGSDDETREEEEEDKEKGDRGSDDGTSEEEGKEKDDGENDEDSQDKDEGQSAQKDNDEMEGDIPTPTTPINLSSNVEGDDAEGDRAVTISPLAIVKYVDPVERQTPIRVEPLTAAEGVQAQQVRRSSRVRFNKIKSPWLELKAQTRLKRPAEDKDIFFTIVSRSVKGDEGD
ncbi:glutamic acid-rich protein-like [Neltuma alba]|uniref:glutamic acid-rich protein-like n=1 Tax=Neltuma alba TaxID=207710 RepID=UPI0010A580FB|nr:glutamic acid-rich protein-like [Prosopis alba]XP_028798919.1 glutamic acid-rich protein-like [Prosopis alba]